jgi:hypothetical protein
VTVAKKEAVNAPPAEKAKKEEEVKKAEAKEGVVETKKAEEVGDGVTEESDKCEETPEP